MDDFRNEKWTLEDGRRAERRVTESVQPSGEAERIVELHVEDERPLRLQHRVVEKRKPFVYEREIQTIDKSGNIVEKKIESIEPKVQMQLVEHISSGERVSALSADVSTSDDCDCQVSKEEIINTIVTAVKALKEEIVSSIPKSAPTVATTPGSLADEVAKRLGGNDQPNGWVDKILWGVIVILIVGLGYVVFGM